MAEREWLGTVEADFVKPEAFWAEAACWLAGDSLHHVVTLNPEMVMEAQTNPIFRNAVAAAEVRVPDGAGIIWARWYLRSTYWSLWPSLLAFMFQTVERVTGVDLLQELAKRCSAAGHPVYLLGGTAAQVSGAAIQLKKEFPNLELFTSRTHAISMDGPPDILVDIIARQPKVVLVAYGSPWQSIWIEQHRKNLPGVAMAVGVGGAFAILAEEQPRAPRLLRKLNLEWLWRLTLEPRRLSRIWRAAVRFPLLIHAQKKGVQRSV